MISEAAFRRAWVLQEADLLLEAPASEVYAQKTATASRGRAFATGAKIATNFVPGGNLVGAAVDAVSGSKFGKMTMDYVRRNLGKLMSARDGTGDPRFDVDDELWGLLSEPSRRAIEKEVLQALQQSNLEMDKVPQGYASRIALDHVIKVSRRLYGRYNQPQQGQ